MCGSDPRASLSDVNSLSSACRFGIESRYITKLLIYANLKIFFSFQFLAILCVQLFNLEEAHFREGLCTPV